MAVHERRSMGRDLDAEGANVIVFNDQMVRRLSGDLDFRRGLRWSAQPGMEAAGRGTVRASWLGIVAPGSRAITE